MSKRTHIKDLKGHIGKEAKIAGFVQTVRNQGTITFLLVRDVSGLIQVVVTKEAGEVAEKAKDLSLESVVEIQGLVKEEKQAPGGFEVEAKEIIVLSEAEPELPIPLIEKGTQEETDQPIRLDWRWIDLRKPKNTLIFKVWTTLEEAFREHLIKKEYIEIHSPKLISTASESGAEVFEVKYFDRKAYLAQSPQFYKQMAMAAGFEKVFEVGPVFRAEPSFTPRHATEFTGYDMEISYIDSHHDVMAEQEEAIKHMIERVEKKYGEEVKEVFDREVTTPKTPFPKLSMKEAKEILKGLDVPSEKDGDLSPEEERKISEYILEKEGNEFVFIYDYPIDVRPFYHMRHEDNPKLTKSYDLLWNGIEITTGAQREHRYDVLMEQAKEKKMDLKVLEFYTNFFRYGCPPHGGLGMGPNRLIMKLLGLENVRDASFIYRGVKRLTP